jgi:hypothetical protein
VPGWSSIRTLTRFGVTSGWAVTRPDASRPVNHGTHQALRLADPVDTDPRKFSGHNLVVENLVVGLIDEAKNELRIFAHITAHSQLFAAL